MCTDFFKIYSSWKHRTGTELFKNDLSRKHLICRAIVVIEQDAFQFTLCAAAQRPLTAAMDSACPGDQAVPHWVEVEGTVTGGFLSQSVGSMCQEFYRVCYI